MHTRCSNGDREGEVVLGSRIIAGLNAIPLIQYEDFSRKSRQLLLLIRHYNDCIRFENGAAELKILSPLTVHK